MSVGKMLVRGPRTKNRREAGKRDGNNKENEGKSGDYFISSNGGLDEDGRTEKG